jgi:LacI family transcriptional regulator
VAKPKRISQQTIAKELGVSQALVSLTLNGQRERISPETYQKIWDYALAAGYRPKGIKIEDSPADTRTRQIGVIMRAGVQVHTQGSYFSHVMHGLNTAALDAGYTTAVLGSEDTLDTARLARFFGPGHAIKGVILMGQVEEQFLTELQQHTSRIVAVSARHAGFCHSVIGNEPEALKAITQHLYDLGHRRIGWLGGNVGLIRHETRYSGLKSAMAKLGLKNNPRYDVLRKEGDRAEGTEAILSLMPLIDRSDFPTAFVTYNISMAIGAIRAMQHADKHVPADCSFAAADFSETASSFTPRITAAGCDPLDLGGRAAAMVMDSSLDASDGVFSDLVLASKLFVGDSTGAVD